MSDFEKKRDALFRYLRRKEVTFPDGTRMELVARTLGIQANKRREDEKNYAARKMRQALKDEESREYQLYLADIPEIPREDILEAIREFRRPAIEADVNSEVFAIPEEFKIENLLDALEAEEAERVNAEWIEKHKAHLVKQRLDGLVSEAREWPREAIEEEVAKAITDSAITLAAQTAWVASTLYDGIYHVKADGDSWSAGERYFPEIPFDIDGELLTTLLFFYFEVDPASQDPN